MARLHYGADEDQVSEVLLGALRHIERAAGDDVGFQPRLARRWYSCRGCSRHFTTSVFSLNSV